MLIRKQSFYLFGLFLVIATCAYSGNANAQLTPQQQQLLELEQARATAQAALNNQQTIVNQNNASVGAAQQALNNANSNLLTAQQGVTSATAAVTRAENALAAAVASGTATPAQLASLEAAVASAQNSLTLQQTALANATAAIAPLQTSLATAQGQLATSNAALTAAQAAATSAAQAINNFRSAIIQANLAAGNSAQQATLNANNFMNSILRDVSTAANVAARQGRNAAYGGQIRAAGGEGCTTGTLGGMLCNIMATSTGGVGIITGFAYIAGLLCGLLGILKLRQHVESPNQVEIWDPIKRFVAGGAFFALPYVADVLRTTIEGTGGGVDSTNTGFNGASSGVGLDAMIVSLMSNIGVPSVWIISWFGWIAGLIFVFIGISRLMQTEQQGPKGPTGIGTIVTFLIAGCLFSINSIITYLNGSVFNTNQIATSGMLQYTDGLAGAADHVHAVISAVIMFSIILGWISVVRGLFIVRGVSEGNSQASMMAAITHLIGGILAVNLGSVIMAVQNTLNITDYGIVFAGAP